MGRLLRILPTSILALFVLFVWPYVFLVSRDLLLHRSHHECLEDLTGFGPRHRSFGDLNATTESVTAKCSACPTNCSSCPGYPYVERNVKVLQDVCNTSSGDPNCTHGLASNATVSQKPGKLRIAIITVLILPKTAHFVTDDSHLRVGHVMENFVNKYKYAYHHDYDFLPIFWNFKDPDLPGAWAKVIALQRYLPHYDWIWCTDVDAFVTNRVLTIEEHVLKNVPLEKAMIVARDCNHFNTGSFFMRNTPSAFKLLDAVYSLRRNTSLHMYEIWYEQSAFIHIFDNDVDGLKSILHVVPQQKINSYRIDCGHQWELGDFVVHFPGGTKKQAAWADLLREGGPVLQVLLP